ncbi:MAG: molybdopterin cofactor-binding domain-containing protein [Beijerinckiaceae bacterium]
MVDKPLPKNLVANPKLARWIRFAEDGSVLLSPGKVEIGQGILTALAQIAADELDVALHSIQLVPADTAMSPNEEVTSGSLSVQDSGMAIRQVAAQVRCLMLDAAAVKLGQPRETLHVVDGIVHGSQNHCVSYRELAPDIALDDKVTTPFATKAVTERHVAGQPVGRIDIPGRVLGTRPYIQDRTWPAMRHGRVLRSQPGAKLEELDESAFHKACPNALLVRNGSFLGVVADNEHEAEKAVSKLAALASWTGGSALPDQTTLPHWLQAQAHETSIVEQRGDASQSHGRSISRSYAKPFIAHASIGPSTALARWQGDTLEVLSHTQGVFNLQRDLALVFELPLQNVLVIHAEGAGCYGHNGADDVALDAALLARAAGCPVRVQWSRADELMQAPFGAAMRMDLAAELDDNGQITHWEHTLYSNGHVARPGRNPTPALLAAFDLDPSAPRFVAGDPPLTAGGGAQRNSVPLYIFPNVIVRQNRVLSNPIRTSSLRSLGAYGNVFAIESFMDELALEACTDPLTFRLKHLADMRARTVLETAAEMANWGHADIRDGRGRGIAFARYKNTSGYCAVVAEVDVEREPRVTELWIAADLGEVINPDGAINQIEGGAIQSVSWTLKEQVNFSRDMLECGSWASYPILRFSEVPKVCVKLIEHQELPPLGAGECAQGPTAAAIGNAVYSALGVGIRQTPITRDRIIGELSAS